MSRRELKKSQTRQLLAETAWLLMADRGFDDVTVADVAREAGVSTATVFNYFPTKEDLFYSRLEASGRRMVDAVAARKPGEPVLKAFQRELLRRGGLLARAEEGDAVALDQLRMVNRVIASSPALQARERLAMARTTAALAELLADESDSVTARVVANALTGVQVALIQFVRERVVADDRPERLAADVRRLGRRAFRQLERGLGDV